jgi:hypothetical protein
MESSQNPTSEIILYQTQDGNAQIDVRLEDETVWLTQAQMADLFQTSVPNVNMHIRNLFTEQELEPEATIKEFLIVRPEGTRSVSRTIEHYNLDVIISVGYRVKSQRGTQFRIWATQRLREYLIKGFTLDDDRLKRLGGGIYFDELLARIRDIRSSEKAFWRKVLEIYATSVDYDPALEASRRFFATIQNKMHWAAHGHTAAEVVAERADASKPNMGMTSWTGPQPRKSDAAVAKNYLNEDELSALNLIVTLYLDFAELQALNRRPMHMADWITKLDDFLRLGEREILAHAGRISHEAAQTTADREFAKYQVRKAVEPGPGERDFEAIVAQTKRLKAAGPTRKKVLRKK